MMTYPECWTHLFVHPLEIFAWFVIVSLYFMASVIIYVILPAIPLERKYFILILYLIGGLVFDWKAFFLVYQINRGRPVHWIGLKEQLQADRVLFLGQFVLYWKLPCLILIWKSCIETWRFKYPLLKFFKTFALFSTHGSFCKTSM